MQAEGNYYVIGHITLFTGLSLSDIIRTRSTGRIFAPDFISFFDGRQPTCITQFRLTQKSTPVESKISEEHRVSQGKASACRQAVAFQKTKTQHWLSLCPQKRVRITFARL